MRACVKDRSLITTHTVNVWGGFAAPFLSFFHTAQCAKLFAPYRYALASLKLNSLITCFTSSYSNYL